VAPGIGPEIIRHCCYACSKHQIGTRSHAGAAICALREVSYRSLVAVGPARRASIAQVRRLTAARRSGTRTGLGAQAAAR
jgi:hypothetical protein